MKISFLTRLGSMHLTKNSPSDKCIWNWFSFNSCMSAIWNVTGIEFVFWLGLDSNIRIVLGVRFMQRLFGGEDFFLKKCFLVVGIFTFWKFNLCEKSRIYWFNLEKIMEEFVVFVLKWLVEMFVCVNVIWYRWGIGL